MPVVHLQDRALIEISGPDAEHLLQNVITTDLDALPSGEARAGALLTPQGKIMFDFLIARHGDDGFTIETRADVVDDLSRRLMLYRLRAKAEITKWEQDVVAVAWGDESAASETDSIVRDARFRDDAKVGRYYGTLPDANGDPAEWHRLRIRSGIAESGTDYALGDAFPHDVLLDQLDGIGLRKGCYVGQEVVSRMHHRGTARRRVLLVHAGDVLPEPGSSLLVDGRPVGTLGTVDGTSGLAIARIDRVKDAMDAGRPIMAGDVSLSLAIPAWANFTFPDTAPAEQE